MTIPRSGPERGLWLKQQRFWISLDEYAQTLEPQVARALLAAIDQLREHMTERELARIIATGDYTTFLDKLDMGGVQLALRTAVEASAVHAIGGELAATGVTTAGTIAVRFDILHPYAVQALREFESQAIATLTKEIQAGVVQYLEQTVPYGINPIQIARGLKGSIGLPQNLVQAGVNYRRMLETGDREALKRALRDKRFDSTVQRAISGGQQLSPQQIDRQMERWYDRAARVNAETITRTATMDAVNVGARLAWRAAIDAGTVDESILRRYWVVARDERVCPICLPVPSMNPSGRRFDEPFVTPVGLVLAPTLHFRCRCIVWTAIEET